MDSHADKYPICRHIKTNGHRCQSPAVTGSGLCYFHRTIRRTHDAACTSKIGPLRPETVQYLLENGQRPAQFAASPACNFPPLEDPEAIQLSISLLFAAIAAGQVEPGLARDSPLRTPGRQLERPRPRTRPGNRRRLLHPRPPRRPHPRWTLPRRAWRRQRRPRPGQKSQIPPAKNVRGVRPSHTHPAGPGNPNRMKVLAASHSL